MFNLILSLRKLIAVCFTLVAFFFILTQVTSDFKRPVDIRPLINSYPEYPQPPTISEFRFYDDGFHWSSIPVRNPVEELTPLPTTPSVPIPRIQHDFPKKEIGPVRVLRERRLQAVRANFSHAWNGYVNYAFLHDELRPMSAGWKDPFGGWAATLIDTLDTLWIMGLYEDFDVAVRFIDEIDFSVCAQETINVFETNIRYLGGLLSAYDLSGGDYPNLLRKAVEVGDLIYVAFDTPNRMPASFLNLVEALEGVPRQASGSTPLAVLGSFSLEMTRLSQITGVQKYYDAVARIMDTLYLQQNSTMLPGMWPTHVNGLAMDATRGSSFTIGALADSAYEYIPKQHLLLGGREEDMYRSMWESAYQAMDSQIFFRPMTTEPNNPVLLPGDAIVTDFLSSTNPVAQHLGCFAGGMVGIAAKVFNNASALEVAEQLTNGCVWAYKAHSQGIMPEMIRTVACEDRNNCPWDEEAWHAAIEREMDIDDEGIEATIASHHLAPGVSLIRDARYLLRPEAIESVFIMYRITGDMSYMHKGWEMFEAIVSATQTDFAHAALADCTLDNPPKLDSMESFWLGETLKYFYLLFSKPDLVNLDEWVFNTEAHPLRRPGGQRI